MTAEEKLSAFLEAGRAPARDPVFEAAVMQSVARRELARTVAVAAVLAGAAATALWVCGPLLNRVVEPAGALLAPAAGVMVATVGLLLLGEELLSRVRGR